MFKPLRMDITATSVVTASITPSSVRNVRILCARNVSIAIATVSRSATYVWRNVILWDGGFAGWPGVGKVGLGPSRRAVAPAPRLSILRAPGPESFSASPLYAAADEAKANMPSLAANFSALYKDAPRLAYWTRQ